MKNTYPDLDLSEVRVIGGGARSDLWNQIKSDVMGIPYVKLAETLRADGFDGAGTIVVADDELGGNLRPYFPKTRLVLAGRRRFEPDRPAQFGSRMVFVWEATEARSRLESAFAAYPEAVRALANARLLKAPWHHLWKPDGYRTSDWNYLILH